MSDFPELDDFSGTPAATDPTSDFLARERALLGDEFGDVSQEYETVQPPSNFADEPEDQFGLGSLSGGAGPMSLNSAAPQVSVTGNNDDDFNSFEDQYPDLSHEPPIAPAVSPIDFASIHSPPSKLRYSPMVKSFGQNGSIIAMLFS